MRIIVWLDSNDHLLYFFLIFLISHLLFSLVYLSFHLDHFLVISTLHSRLLFSQDLFSIYIPLFILFSLFCLYPVLLSVLSGCSAKSNSPSYNSPHAISNNSGRAASSVFSSWICGEDRHISEVSWSASSSFLSFFLCLSLYYMYLTSSLEH
jgi:hypothetical protein